MILTLILSLGALALVQLGAIAVLSHRVTRLAAPAPAVTAAEWPAELVVNALKKLDSRIDALETRPAAAPAIAPDALPADRSYMLAQRLAKQGASAQQIAETCGIFASEAELLQRLHGGTRH
jgi:hypothetical protein